MTAPYRERATLALEDAGARLLVPGDASTAIPGAAADEVAGAMLDL